MSSSAWREEIEPAEARPEAREGLGRALAIAGGTVLLFAALFGLGYLPKLQQREQLASQERELGSHVPQVKLVRPARPEAVRSLTLPGSIEGSERAVVYARADGYVSQLAADLGDRVSAGQVLARLDMPEVDREIEQAHAGLASSEAALLRARAAREQSAANLKRYLALTPGLASREELEHKQTQTAIDEADVAVADAARAGQHANLARLRQLKAFSEVRAPFAGKVTARHVERGSLVARGKDSPLFEITALDTVRIVVQVPQSRAAQVAIGQRAELRVTELGTRSFEGRVTRTAGALESSTRTLNVRVEVANPDGKLLPGMYASVALDVQPSQTNWVVPATALLLGEQGVRVAVVDGLGTVKLTRVDVERDRGPDVEIANGLRGDESIIANPAPSIADGSIVRTL